MRDRFEKVFVTKPGSVKQSNLSGAIDAFKKSGVDFTADADYKKMIVQALEESAKSGSTLLVTGSFYLVAEVKKILESL